MKSTVHLYRLLPALLFWTLAGPLAGQSRATLLAGFDQPPDASAVEWMEQEVAGLFSEAGLAFSWRPLKPSTLVGATELLVSVQFHGNCRVEMAAPAADGPMAWVQSLDGEIRPFIDVDCDRTAAMVWPNRGTLPGPLLRRTFGRALGRVMAHELYHYLTQSAAHTASELFSQGMNSRDLTMPQVRFEAAEIEALRRGMSKLGGTARPPATE